MNNEDWDTLLTALCMKVDDGSGQRRKLRVGALGDQGEDAVGYSQVRGSAHRVDGADAAAISTPAP
ncbi:hypothetical protein AB0N28_23025 [Streptomyces sp. NPDC051130]|uniref:hypothetical protein n=1 Tax=Streptomyces sp. NPDC051130 TaxID=3157223 RepID=UPI003448BC8A